MLTTQKESRVKHKKMEKKQSYECKQGENTVFMFSSSKIRLCPEVSSIQIVNQRRVKVVLHKHVVETRQCRSPFLQFLSVLSKHVLRTLVQSICEEGYSLRERT
jgi:hypothetical protein